MTNPREDGIPAHLLASPTLSSWVTVEDGVLAVRVGRVELGQGIVTALAQIAADALGLPVERIRMLPALTGTGPDQGLTAGSTSVPVGGAALRRACAAVRSLAVAAAADAFGVPAVEVEVRRDRLVSGERSLPYADVVAGLDPRTDLTSVAVPADGRSGGGAVGTNVARLDLPDKVLGRPRYISDLRLPGMLHGRVVRPPSPGSVLLGVDETGAVSAGARVVRDGSFLGVVAAREADVDRAVGRLREGATWKEHDTLPDEHRLGDILRDGPHERVVVVDDSADAPAVDEEPDGTVRRSYSRPYLAHASIAPSCGVARWSDADEEPTVRVWSHSQGVHQLRDAIATTLVLDPSEVVVEHVENAGCYGHNAADDAAFDAVLLARDVPGVPVMARWSRQDELTWSPMAPAMAVDLAATVADGGAGPRITRWRADVFGQGHTSRPGYAGVPGLLAGAHLAQPVPLPPASDPPPAAGGGTTRNALPIYEVGHRLVTGHRLVHAPLRSSAMRALGAFMNVFAIESFMDELAEVAGADPVHFRLDHLVEPRAREVIETAAAVSGWTRPRPEEVGRGLGFARYKGVGAYCAVVAEVAVDHLVRVRRLTAVVDVGRVVNPDGVRNQIEGGATQSTSWTTKEQVRFDRRRITSEDWESYPILRFSEAPAVDVHLIDRPDLPSLGAGEAAMGPTAAAIANAVHDALGVRVRDLPITADAVVRTIEATP